MQENREHVEGVLELRVKLNPLNSFYIPGWPGVFSAKIFHDIASSAGLRFSKTEEKNFSITPIKPLRMDGYPEAGVYESKNSREWRWLHVDEGDILSFSIYTSSKDLATRIVSELNRIQMLKEPCGKFELAGIEGRLIPVRCINDVDFEGEYINLRLVVHYITPTRFMLKGLCLDYPSHVRFMKSLAKSYFKLTGLESLRTHIDKLALLRMEYERTGDKTVQCYVDIGHENNIRRLIRAFHGRASYLLQVREGEVEMLQELLKVGEALGVGVNRSLGLGRIKTAIIKLQC
jgi:CRISPR-associated endoribonuclease Cas6